MNQLEDDTTSTPGAPIGEAQREQRVDVLAEAFALGRLTKDEFDVRLTLVLTAHSQRDANAALFDLPHDEWPVDGLFPAPSERVSQPPVRGRPRTQQEAWWRWALAGVICLMVWVAPATPAYFWPGWVIGPWGLVLLTRRARGSTLSDVTSQLHVGMDPSPVPGWCYLLARCRRWPW